MEESKYNKIVKVAKELSEYAELEGTEIGEACRLLVSLANYPDYLSPVFIDTLLEEMKSQLDCFREQGEIIEHEIKHCYKTFEWFR